MIMCEINTLFYVQCANYCYIINPRSGYRHMMAPGRLALGNLPAYREFRGRALPAFAT